MESLQKAWTKWQDFVLALLVMLAMMLCIAILVISSSCKRDPIVVDVSNYEKVYLDVLPPDVHLPANTTPGDFGIDISLPASATSN